MKKNNPQVLNKKTAYVASYRRKQTRLGLRRIELSLKPNDATLIKNIAATLRADGPEAAALRTKLQHETAIAKPKTGAELLALLRQGPLFESDMDFPRDKEPGRSPIELD